MPAWAPYSDSPADADFAMEHSGESFITNQLMLGMTTMESYNEFSAADIQYGLEEVQRNKVIRTFVRNAFTFHLNEIFSAVRNEYTDWDKPIQHPINIRYVPELVTSCLSTCPFGAGQGYVLTFDCLFFRRDSTMEALSDGHTVAPLMRVGYLHARRGAKTYIFHFNYQAKDSDYPQVGNYGIIARATTAPANVEVMKWWMDGAVDGTEELRFKWESRDYLKHKKVPCYPRPIGNSSIFRRGSHGLWAVNFLRLIVYLQSDTELLCRKAREQQWPQMK